MSASSTTSITPLLLRTDDGQWLAVSASGETHSLGFYSSPDVTSAPPRNPFPLPTWLRGPILLGLPASCCYVAQLEFADGDPNDLTLLTYDIEPQLPVVAEDVVAAVVGPRDVGSLVVAAEHAEVAAVISTLENANVFVRSIVPTAFLGLDADSSSGRHLTIQVGESIDSIVTVDGIPVSWQTGASAEELPASWSLIGNDPIDAATVIGNGYDHDAIVRHIQEVFGPDVVVDTIIENVISRAARHAADIIHRKRKPIIDLAVGPLAVSGAWRSSIPLLTAMLLLFSIVVGYIGWIFQSRASEYQQVAAAYEQQQRELFEQLFPDTPPPSAVLSRLQSERRQLDTIEPHPATRHSVHDLRQRLRAVLAALPTDIPVTLLLLDITGQTVTLNCRLKTENDAESLTAAFQRNKTFTIASSRVVKTTPDVLWECQLNASVQSDRADRSSPNQPLPSGGTP